MRIRFLISLEEENLKKLDAEVVRLGSARTTVIERLIEKHGVNTLDTTSGQARELADSLRARKRETR